jgi:hypothetical protein
MKPDADGGAGSTIRIQDNFLIPHQSSRYNSDDSRGSTRMAEQVYKPSERVPVSGVYRVDHNGHREAHEATLLEGEVFPACASCEERVRFTLKHRAISIHQDDGFPRR